MRPEEKLFDAVTGIDEELVDSTQAYTFRKQVRPWQRVASLAACLLIIASIGFGIVQMGHLGGAGSDSAADSSTTGNSSAPENGSTGGSGVTDGGDDTGDQGAAAETTTFTATVLEVGDGYLLVEPVAGDPLLATADRIQVSTGNVDLPDGVEEGVVVDIAFTGGVMESYPAQISGVTEVTLAGE